ncbi:MULTISPECIES: hypothetical protein [Hyphomicrobiales]|jgi:hypothetical protein|nr:MULTISPECIES: hypothetical protein [Hyphomicrobiales]EZQ15246.1 hypothetical protein CF98_12540 [Halopseudomonas bauzanensis]TDR32073.1 hypothetical protein DES43_12914 [Aquamicrobium defluvii]SFQ63097.1 hypothetical protein SAMN05216176_10811 [Nitratireductor indicus]
MRLILVLITVLTIGIAPTLARAYQAPMANMPAAHMTGMTSEPDGMADGHGCADQTDCSRDAASCAWICAGLQVFHGITGEGDTHRVTRSVPAPRALRLLQGIEPMLTERPPKPRLL